MRMMTRLTACHVSETERHTKTTTKYTTFREYGSMENQNPTTTMKKKINLILILEDPQANHRTSETQHQQQNQ